MAETRAEKLAKEIYKPNSKYVLVVAHRGDWRNAPENSLQAYRNCIDMGVDMIEIDIHKTQDNQFIVMHDATVDRTTNGKGKIADMTLADIKKLYLKSGHGIKTRHRVPTLEEVLLLAKDKILVNIDKGDNYFDEIYELLLKTGTEKQVVIKTYDNLATIQSKSKNDIIHKSIFMPIINLDKQEDAEVVVDNYLHVNPPAFEVTFKTETPKLFRVLNKIRQSGSKLWINSLWSSLNAGHDDDLAVEEKCPDEAWGWILKQGATVIQTDRPMQLIQYLKKKHRH
ncbi:MAG: glycerophosphodiester phosphodiesterase family protein [Prevotellaceae bacterium]|nr:glycerophosphodiester phosphodiesterase family protein [Prevotellaceae bacterium]